MFEYLSWGVVAVLMYVAVVYLVIGAASRLIDRWRVK